MLSQLFLSGGRTNKININGFFEVFLESKSLYVDAFKSYLIKSPSSITEFSVVAFSWNFNSRPVSKYHLCWFSMRKSTSLISKSVP